MLRATRLLILAVVLGTAVSAQKVKIDFDKQADFSRIRTYQWRTHPVFEKKPELKQLYATGIQLVLEAGNQQLMKSKLVPDDFTPNVFITFFLDAELGQTVKVVDSGPWWGTGYYGWYSPAPWTTTEIDQYVDGTLVIDIVDAATTKLLWRAYCGDKIRDMRTRDKNITSAVKKALGKFPPKSK